jgi:hypothetical protein
MTSRNVTLVSVVEDVERTRRVNSIVSVGEAYTTERSPLSLRLTFLPNLARVILSDGETRETLTKAWSDTSEVLDPFAYAMFTNVVAPNPKNDSVARLARNLMVTVLPGARFPRFRPEPIKPSAAGELSMVVDPDW